MQELGQAGRLVVGLDRSAQALRFCRLRQQRRLCRSDAVALPFKDGKFDLVTALDVCEHLNDDAAGLREIARVTRPGGWVILTVPAFAFLWSDHDRVLWHKRRYTLSQLTARVTGAGLSVARISYFNLPIFPAACVFRFAKRIWKRRGPPTSDFLAVPPLLNSLLTRLLALETSALKRLNLPLGLSLVCVARKADHLVWLPMNAQPTAAIFARSRIPAEASPSG